MFNKDNRNAIEFTKSQYGSRPQTFSGITYGKVDNTASANVKEVNRQIIEIISQIIDIQKMIVR